MFDLQEEIPINISLRGLSFKLCLVHLSFQPRTLLQRSFETKQIVLKHFESLFEVMAFVLCEGDLPQNLWFCLEKSEEPKVRRSFFAVDKIGKDLTQLSLKSPLVH